MEVRKTKEVVTLLLKAQEFSKTFIGGSSSQFKSTLEFRDALTESIVLLKAGDTSQLKRVYQWFLPSSSWYEVIGPDGNCIGKEIREKLNEVLRRELIERWNSTVSYI